MTDEPTVKFASLRAALVSAAGALIALGGCAMVAPIQNYGPVGDGAGYQPHYRAETATSLRAKTLEPPPAPCTSANPPVESSATATSVLTEEEQLSPGDLVEIHIGEDDILSGMYKVSQAGTLRLPHLTGVLARGLTVDAVETAVTERLLAAGFYRTPPMVSVRIVDTASARVFVTGAVFEPGATLIGGVEGKDVDTLRQKAPGWTAEGRRLARALKAAGGVRPDADLSRVTLIRGNTRSVIDIRSALLGKPYQDPVLQAGDEIEVASRGCFQEALMVPSTITPDGIRVYMSNLTQPASSNALSQIAKDSQEMRYGVRFMQAMVGMNCVGGARWTNADRSVVLMTHNPVTGASIVISRRVEDMVSRPDRDRFNPYLLPGDAMACYDSRQTNLLAIANAFGAVVSNALLASEL